MTCIHYKQKYRSKESKIDDLYLLYAIFIISLQKANLYGNIREEGKDSYTPSNR